MEPICDLHVHSAYSDGTCTPRQLIVLAEQSGVSAVALCDHNTVAGLPEFLDAGKDSPVEAVPGIEFSADYEGGEVHILGLFIQENRYEAVRQKLRQALQWKEQSNRDLVEGLKRAGIALDYDEICAANPGANVNRAVIGAELVRKGCCTDVKDAFARYLNESCGYFHPPRRLDALEVVRFLKSVGAVAVLAHPFLNLEEARLREFLRQAVPVGLDAMEVYYPKFSSQQHELAGKIAAEFGILPSGGSDFHGENKPDIRLGTGRGDLNIPRTVLERLKDAAARNNKLI